jgi:hypothetical protein
MRRFTFLKGTNTNINSTNSNFHTSANTNTHTHINSISNNNTTTLDEIKNASLPKTASTINQNRTQTNLA